MDLLQRDVDSLLRDVNAIMSTYDSASELSRLNASSRLDSVPVSAELAQVLRQSLDVYEASGGRFDVTVGPLVDAWGFGPVARPDGAPGDAVLDSLRAFVGSDKLRLGAGFVQKLHPAVRIDLSAIAKGYGVDRVSDLLLARGFANHLVEIGGELRARGRNARGAPFRVGIEEPDPDAVRVRLAVELDDRALASSGNYRNFYEQDGVRYVHTLDPVTARPVQHRLLAVSVLHAECALADAWATALMAAGPERAWTLAQDNTLDVLLLVDGGDGTVRERMTPGFEAAVRRLSQ
jgi:thiamine biosynthesis lipoprotein